MQDKKAMYEVALYLLAHSDEGSSTEMLKKAIEDINKLIHVRENLPF